MSIFSPVYLFIEKIKTNPDLAAGDREEGSSVNLKENLTRPVKAHKKSLFFKGL